MEISSFDVHPESFFFNWRSGGRARFSNMAKVDMLEFLRLAKRRTTLSHKRFAILRCNWASNQHSGPSPLFRKALAASSLGISLLSARTVMNDEYRRRPQSDSMHQKIILSLLEKTSLDPLTSSSSHVLC